MSLSLGLACVLMGGCLPLSLAAEERLIPSGQFLMGDASAGAEGLLDERPTHPVQVSPFYLESLVVSAALWQEVAGWGLTNGYHDLPPGDPGSLTNGDLTQPVTGVSWYDAVKWCNARSEMAGLTPVYYTDATQAQPYRSAQIDLSGDSVRWTASGYRLPSEAEWEYAARGALAGQDYPWAGVGGSYRDHLDGSRANYRNSGDPMDNETTAPGYYDGGQQPPGRPANNGFWLFEMAGNVVQWCWDAYAPDEYAARLADGLALDPHGPEPVPGCCRSARGGSWDSSPFDLRCSFRDPAAPGQRDTRTGLRCARSVADMNQIVIASFDLNIENGQTVVRWATAAEPGLTGFYLYRVAGEASVLVVLNLIAATGATQGGIGASYACVDPTSPSSAVYQLVELLADGGMVTNAPFARTAYRLELTGLVPPATGGAQVHWRSRSNEWYSVWCSTNLANGFTLLRQWIATSPPENGFVDSQTRTTNAFYRVSAEP